MTPDQRIGYALHSIQCAVKELASLQHQNPWAFQRESQWINKLHGDLGKLVYRLPNDAEDIFSHHWRCKTGEIETSSSQSLQEAQDDIDDYAQPFLRAGMKYLCTTVTGPETSCRTDWSDQVVEAAGSENVLPFVRAAE